MKPRNLTSTGHRLAGLSQIWSGPNPFDLIEQAELPAPIKQVIQRVVRKSGLWRIERVEVATELLAHFEDGLRSGKAADKLIHDFGDPLVAAELIRSSKIRNRSMNTKLLYGGLWGLFAFVLTYFGLTAFYHAGKANPSHDYLGDFNQTALSVAPEDAAWPIYRPAFTQFEFAEGGDGKFPEIFVSSETKAGNSSPDRLVTPQDGEAWKTAVEKLDDSAELLNAFRSARLKSHLGLPLYVDRTEYSEADFAALFPNQEREELVSDDASTGSTGQIMEQSMVAILLPHYQVFRTAARILTVDTRWAIEQGDFERVTQNVEAVYGIGRQLGNESILIGDLVGFAIQSMGHDLMDELLPKHLEQFSADQLARLQSAAASSDPAAAVNLDGEKFMAMDIFQRCFTDDGNGDGRITLEGFEAVRQMDRMFLANQPEDLGFQQQLSETLSSVTAPFAMMQFPGRKDVEAEYVELLEQNERELNKPFYAAASAPFSDAVETSTNPFTKLLFPALKQIATAMFRCKGQQEATVAAIAVYRYQKQTGKLPATLEELLGDYLEELPVDQFNGKPLRYERKDQGFILYSIGFDRTDNGGKRPLVAVDASEPNSSDKQPQPTSQYRMFGDEKSFDWVLWPRQSQQAD